MLVSCSDLKNGWLTLFLLSLAAHGLAGEPIGTIVFRPSTGDRPAAPESALVIGRAHRAPTIDGVIEIREWAHAGFGGFDLAGDRGKHTYIFAQHDERALYFAFRCLEPQPDKIAARYGPGKVAQFAPDQTGDSHCYYDDSIEVFISPDARQ